MNDKKSEPGDELRGFERSLSQAEHTLDRFLEVADVDKVFGEPIHHGETTVVPTAEVLSAMGFGYGFGRGSEGGDNPEREGGGGGGGGGGSIIARPVAVVVASPGEVRVEPVFDVTKVALAALTAGGFMLATWLKMSR